jgi:3'-phosphoadenosine 5'-phosphosulfate (PAPS) 3'-phosphatase
MEDGKPVLSVVGGPSSPFDHPTRSEESKDGSPIFFAVEGAGSWTQMVLLGKTGVGVNQRKGLQIVEPQMRGQALKMDSSEKIKRGNDGLYDVLGTEQIVFAQNHHIRQDVFQDGRNLAKVLGSEFPKMIWSDSSLKYCWLARGELDALWYFPQGLYNNDVLERATHHAAGSLIAKEAGAKIYDLEGKELVWCGPLLKENRGALAIDPKKLDIDGVVSAVMEATGDSDAAYAYRCEKRKEHAEFMIALAEEVSKTINEEGSEQEKKVWNKAKKGMKGYLEDDKEMDKMAQRKINAEQPIFGNRPVQSGEDVFR